VAHCIFVGCDAHDKRLLLRYAVDRGTIQQRGFHNNAASRGAMIRWLVKKAQALGGATVYFAYEASGLGFILYDELTEAGILCHVLAPTRIERSPHHRRNKCDAKDADRLLEILRGHVLAGNRLPAVWVPDAETRDAREVVRGRLRMAQKVTAAKNEIQSLLKRFGVERPKGLGKSWTKGYRGWLESLAGSQGPLGRGAMVLLTSQLGLLGVYEKEMAYFDHHIEALAATAAYRPAAESMEATKGVSVLTAMVVLTELGDLARFPNRRAVAAYVGLVPSKHESGEANDRKGHITRQGPPRVRRVLAQAAWSWTLWDPGAKAAYERLVARNPKKKKIALVAMMRRLLIRLWHRGLEAQRPARDARADTPGGGDT
jgi:transposase